VQTLRHHLDRLAVVFILYGALHMVAALLLGVLMTALAGGLFAVGLDEPDPALVAAGGFYGVTGLAIAALAVLFAVPNVLAGAALGRRHRWGRAGGLVCAAMALSNLPIGTLIGLYALVTLLDPEVREDFQTARG
jgi:hypothetical protein